MGKIIGLTYDLKTDWQVGPDDPIDANAELDTMYTVDRIALALERGGHVVKKIGNVYNLLKQVQDLGVDIIFNICEGRGTRSRESQVPMLLEMYGIPYVGTDAVAQGVSLDKVFTKKMMIADDIPTPRFFVAETNDDLKKLNIIGFPLIVKTRHEGTSKGMSLNSRVSDWAGLKRQVELINKRYRQPALVEEFIRGTEFTVPVLGNEDPQAMPVIQVSINGQLDLGDEFFTFERVTGEAVQYVCPAKINEKLYKKMQDIAIRVYKSIECRDFGRVDFRVDEKGNPFVLEINPLPSLAEKDVFNLFPYKIGSSYDETVNKIVNFALARYGLLDRRKSRRRKKADVVS